MNVLTIERATHVVISHTLENVNRRNLLCQPKYSLTCALDNKKENVMLPCQWDICVFSFFLERTDHIIKMQEKECNQRYEVTSVVSSFEQPCIFDESVDNDITRDNIVYKKKHLLIFVESTTFFAESST